MLLSRSKEIFARELAQNQRLSPAALAELSLTRQRELLRFAFDRIPYYRKKFADAGIDAGDLDQPDILARLPILERRDIVENEASLLNPAIPLKRLPVFTTGGSTGKPLKTYGDPGVPHAVLSWRMLNWWGVNIRDNSAYLYRTVPDGWRRIAQRVALWPTRRTWISAARMNEENLERFYRELQHVRPRYLVGYVGAIDVFARFLEARGYQVPGLQAVWTTSAPLPEIKRTYFENILGCPAYTQYGSCEFYWIAAECREKNGMHIATDARVVEVVNERGETVPNGEWGDLVVTDLLNYAFPLIRYRIGDRGRLLNRTCSCGLPFPLMDYVRGRVSDLIRVPGGATVPGEYWTTIFDDFTTVIKAFQVHQQRNLTVIIRYEPYSGQDAAPVVRELTRRFEALYGKALRLDWRQEVLPLNDAGKLRLVTSDV